MDEGARMEPCAPGWNVSKSTTPTTRIPAERTAKTALRHQSQAHQYFDLTQDWRDGRHQETRNAPERNRYRIFTVCKSPSNPCGKVPNEDFSPVPGTLPPRIGRKHLPPERRPARHPRRVPPAPGLRIWLQAAGGS